MDDRDATVKVFSVSMAGGHSVNEGDFFGAQSEEGDSPCGRKTMKPQYSVVVQWSDEDQAYLVMLPEFGPDPQTHGDTYKEAMKRAVEVMETLIEFYEETGRPLPEPARYGESKQTKKATKKRRQRVLG